jgi:hypothetical protein
VRAVVYSGAGNTSRSTPYASVNWASSLRSMMAAALGALLGDVAGKPEFQTGAADRDPLKAVDHERCDEQEYTGYDEHTASGAAVAGEGFPHACTQRQQAGNAENPSLHPRDHIGLRCRVAECGGHAP